MTRTAQTPTVLVVEDEEDIRHLVATCLDLEGFRVLEAADGNEGVRKALEMRPDLILMDVMMPGLSGTEALAQLRRHFRTQFTPVVFLTARSLVTDKVDALIGGADDYIVKPFDPEELVARVRVALRRSQSLRGLNPLTGLPGNPVIVEEIEKRLAARRPFALLYLDLDDFKAYNDHYGFSRGDDVIAALSRVILEALEAQPSPEHFAGHVGGDDFVILTVPEPAEGVAADICRRFDQVAPTLYDPDDRARRFIEVADRRGRRQRFPLVSVSVGIVLSGERPFGSAAEISAVAAEVKAVAKRQPGSSWAVDRRRA